MNMGSLGMPEILMILVIALIIFGPRKLPELGKTLGQSLAQFRRASEDFKRQWEDEVEMERRRIAAPQPEVVEHSNSSVESSGEELNATAPGEASAAATEEHAPVPDVETVPTTQPEPAIQETRRDWM
jgi:TatA/E family protein of Tat protein translocase